MEKKLFNTILSCLSLPSKQLLFDKGIKLPAAVNLGSPLFDYISFCGFPTDYIIGRIIIETMGVDIETESWKKMIQIEIE